VITLIVGEVVTIAAFPTKVKSDASARCDADGDRGGLIVAGVGIRRSIDEEFLRADEEVLRHSRGVQNLWLDFLLYDAWPPGGTSRG
jgi:hypothetical protein